MSGITGSAIATGLETTAGGSRYPNPFFDISSAYMPQSISEMFKIGEFMMTAVQPFMTVTQRVISYFVTEIEVSGPSDEECEERKEFLTNKMHILEKLIDIGVNWMTYGNVFISVYFPFDRYLTCTQCGLSLKADKISFAYDAGLIKFDAGACPKCKSRAARRCDDRRSPDTDRSRIIIWNPKRIRLRVHPVSGKKEIYLSLDQKLVERVRMGSQFHILDTPMSMLRAIAASPVAGGAGGEVIYKFTDGAVYHMSGTSLSGSGVQGWGLPPILSSIKNAYYVQLLRRYDEAIAHDFIVPLRFLFPKSTGGTTADPVMQTNLGGFRANLQTLIKRHRQRPDEYYVAPCEVGYTMIGGEARVLAPKENIMAASDELLNNLGYPAELFKGTLTLQALPAALRLFERHWAPLVGGITRALKFVDMRTSNHFMWDEADTKLRSITLADDIERKALLLQAAAGGVVSNTTAYAPIDVDYRREQKRIIEEQRHVARLQAEAESEEAAQNEATEEGGPAQAAQTPGDVMEEAAAVANQLLTQVPESMRRGELAKIKASNPQMHAMVKQEMDNIRNEWARQGRAGVEQQAVAAAQGGA